jgi:outer membrane receptor protein involved in Fe transport
MRIALTFSLFFFGFNLLAQTGSIEGVVLDSTSVKPIEYAMVRLFSPKDSSIVSGIYTDEKGYFLLEDVPFGKFYIVISNPGYKNKTLAKIQVDAQLSLRKLGSIALVQESTELDEVIIQREKNQLSMGLDKKIYNVGDDISSSGASATDVLNNVPSIEIDQDGSISLRGDGNVTILIDGKPSNLAGGSGKSILEGIPASSIERIEIVTNPSAKYDPDGTSGIINIVLKKNIRRGLNGNVNASAGTGNLYTAGASLSMRNTRFNLYGNYAFSHRDGYRNNFSDLSQSVGDSLLYLNQSRIGADLNITHTAKVGMDVYLKDRNTLSFSVSGNLGDRTRSGDQVNTRYYNDYDTVAIWNRKTEDPNQNKSIDLSLGYEWLFKEEKGSIVFNAYESIGREANQGYYLQDTTYPYSSSVTDQRLFNNESNNVTTISMDIVRILKKNWRSESGLKMIHRDMTMWSNSDQLDATGTYQSDTISNFNYAYAERIYSAYGQIGSQWKKLKFQAGVRLEYSSQRPSLLNTKQSYNNEYFNAFPSATLRYAYSSKGEISLGYSRRINRPNSNNLNPFTSYADPYNLRMGNPALKPEYINSFDLGVDYTTKKVSITWAFYQRYTSSVIQRVKLFYENGTSAATFANIDNSISSGTELVFQYRPLPIWRNMLSLNGNYITYQNNSTNSNINWNNRGVVFGGKISSTLELMKRTLILQVNARYNAPSVTAQGRMQPRGSVDFSVDKTLFDSKWGFGLRVTDIFNTQGFNFEVEQPLVRQNSEFKWETRRLIFSIRYTFGKTNFKEDKKSGDNGGGGFDF